MGIEKNREFPYIEDLLRLQPMLASDEHMASIPFGWGWCYAEPNDLSGARGLRAGHGLSCNGASLSITPDHGRGSVRRRRPDR
jgi:hypothetical protein